MQRAFLPVVFWLAVLLASPLAAQVPEGPTSLVRAGAFCADDVSLPAVAANGAGNYLLVWEEIGGACNLMGQLFASDGSALGDPFALAPDPDGVENQHRPSIGVTPDGGFFVAWDQGEDGPETIRVLPLSPDGAANGGAVVFEPVDPGVIPSLPRIDIGASGSAVAVWEEFRPQDAETGLFGLLLTPGGALLGLQLPTEGILINPAVAVAPDGSFALVWEDETAFTDGEAEIFGLLFDASGKPTSDPFQLNLATPDLQRNPQVEALPGGGFATIWDSAPVEFFDGFPFPVDAGVFGRFIDGPEPSGPELQINSFIAGFQVDPALAIDGATGGIFVAWNDDSAELDVPRGEIEVPRDRLSGQWLSPDGFYVGDQVRLDADGEEAGPGSPIGRPAVAALGEHRWVVVWLVAGPAAGTFELYARRFGPSELYLDCVAGDLCAKGGRLRGEGWR